MNRKFNQSMNDYFGDREFNDQEYNIMIGYLKKIETILRYDKEKLKTLLNKFSNTFFNVDNVLIDKHQITYNKIFDRVNEYFSRQKNKQLDFRSLINIIKYQYIVTTKFTTFLGKLTLDDKPIDISETFVDISNMYRSSKTKKYLNDLAADYIEKIKLESLEKKTEVQSSSEFQFLELIILNIVKKSLFILQDLICYGSYTNHVIHQVHYDDIDVYFPGSFYYLVLLMFSIKMISGYNLNILGYPFIDGHLALYYKDRKLIDCIYLNKYVLNKINIADINGIKFIDPLLQFLNQIRMNNELFRCHKIFENPVKYQQVFYSFLLYIKSNYKSFIPKLVKKMESEIVVKDIKYDFDDGNNVCTFHLDKFLNIPEDGFDKVILILSEPNTIIEELKEIYGVYSIKYNAFLNEIFFETRQKTGGSKEKKKVIDRKTLGKNSLIKKIEENKKYLIMSNLTNTLYINLEKKTLSIKNIQSVLATVCVYSFLKSNTNFAWTIFHYLLAIIKKPLEKNFNTDFLELTRYRKEEKRHIKLNIETNSFNDFKIDKKEILVDYLDKDRFIELYGPNGGY